MKYLSPLRIPQGEKGNFAIQHDIHPKGEPMTIISHRDALFSGLKPQSVILDDDTVVHKLIEKGAGKGVWMSDCLQEWQTHQEAYEKCKGRVLVGGLGLGYFPKMLDSKKNVKDITVIEIRKEVIGLVWKHLNLEKKATIVNQDLFKYLKSEKFKNQRYQFNTAYFDIWTQTGEDTLFTHVRPIRELCEGFIPQDNIYCWEESTMLGQMKFALATCFYDVLVKMSDKDFYDYYNVSRTKWAFLNWYRQNYGKIDKDELAFKIDSYVMAYKYPRLYAEEWKQYERGERFDKK